MKFWECISSMSVGIEEEQTGVGKSLCQHALASDGFFEDTKYTHNWLREHGYPSRKKVC